MRAPFDLGAQRRRRLRTSRLWLLSAILGAVTIYAMVATVHDTGLRREAARRATRETANHLVAHANERLQVFTLQSFAPVAPWTSPSHSSGTTAVETLARGQRDADRCRCRETVQASAFFRFDVGGDTLHLTTVSRPTPSGRVVRPRAALDSVLVALARDEVRRATHGRRSWIHLSATPRLGDQAVVTVIQHDTSGAPVAVYGALTGMRDLMSRLFTIEPHRPTLGDTVPSFASVLPRPDSVSLEVAVAGQAPLFGSIGSNRSYRATVYPRSAMEGLAVTVGLAPEQVLTRVLVPRTQLWLLGLLLASTVLVIAIAVGSSRREALLASARSDFIAGVSHELRMPLAQILIASETLTLKRDRDEGERLELAGSILREAKRVIALVENVLLFSRSGAVALRPRLEPVPVAELFDEVVESVRLAVEDAGQTIEAAPAPSVAIMGDRALIRQALVNLVDNALKYGAQGQRISLSVAEGGGRVELFVDDEGPGVPRAQRERVLEPYERLARDQTSERTGTGLGLAVVRHIASACGGRVRIDEAPRGGTRAVLELAAAAVPQPLGRTLETA